MDLLKGAQLLAERLAGLQEQDTAAMPTVETGAPIFRWFGIEPPADEPTASE